MVITLRYFAALREIVGREQEQIEMTDDATIADLRALVASRSAASAAVLARCIVARNRVYATDATALTAGDEVAFIPPMAGG